MTSGLRGRDVPHRGAASTPCAGTVAGATGFSSSDLRLRLALQQGIGGAVERRIVHPLVMHAQGPPPAEGLGLAAVARRAGWSGPGRAAVVARAVRWGVAAARAGPDRVGSRGAAIRGGVARPADGVRHTLSTRCEVPKILV